MHDQHRAVLRAAVLPLAVTAITLRSLAHPGYLVQIDSAYGLRTVPGDWSFYSPVRLLTVLGQTLVGGAITGSIYVCLALFLCGFSAMLLLRTQPWWAQGAGGLLAMLNPFVYDRLVEGQWSIVVATAGLLFVVAAWLSLRHSPRPVAAIWLALSILLTLAFSADFAGILLVLLAIAGAVLDGGVGWLLALGAIGLVVSGSTATRPGLSFVLTAVQHVPILAVYREPQKWDVLWLLALVVLAPAALVGVAAALQRRAPRLRAAAGPALAAVMAAVVLAPAGWFELTAASTVVRPVQYPQAWYETEAYMGANVPAAEPVAILPWHLYEVLPFVGRPTVDPAPVFFPGNLVRSEDPELPGGAAQNPIAAASRSAP